MKGRKKNFSQNHQLFSITSSKKDEPWNASRVSNPDAYDALLDENTNSYFISLNVLTHCKNL